MADPADRYQLLQSLPSAPGYDWLTKSDIGPFIDTTVDVKFTEIGRIYLSVDTIRQMAQAAGLFDSLEAVDPDRDLNLHGQGYRKGIDDRGAFDLAIGELRAIADRLAVGPVLVSAAVDEVDAEAEPPVFVTDGPDAAAVGAGADEEIREPVAVGGQSAGASRNRRPSRVSASASDANPFRI